MQTRLVVCVPASEQADPAFIFVNVECTGEQYDFGQHLSAVRDWAAETGNANATVFHIDECPAFFKENWPANPVVLDISQNRQFYKTVVVVEILSEDRPYDCCDLAAIARDIDTGECVGTVRLASQVFLNESQMANALTAAGSEPGFFQISDSV